MSSECRDVVRRYLRPFPYWTLFLAGVGLLIMLAGSQLTERRSPRGRDSDNAQAVVVFVGGLLVLCSIVVIAGHRRPADAEFDRCFGHALKSTPAVALQKLGLDDSQVTGNYVYFWSPRPSDIALIGREFVPYRFRRGRDDLFRFASYNVMILAPTQTHLGIYTAEVNLLLWNWLSEGTGEYYYRDVVSIQTRPGILALTFRDSRAFEIAFPGGRLAESLYESTSVPFVPLAEAVGAVRKMIQPHKSASA